MEENYAAMLSPFRKLLTSGSIDFEFRHSICLLFGRPILIYERLLHQNCNVLRIIER